MHDTSGSGSLGEVIRRRRLEFGWSQEELAVRVSDAGDDVRQSDISRLELGKVGLPRRARLERIAAALEMPLGELLARSGWAAGGPIAGFGPELASGFDADLSSFVPDQGRELAPNHFDAPAPSQAAGMSVRLQDAIAEARLTMARSAAAIERAREVYDFAVNPLGRQFRGESGGGSGQR